MTLYIRFRLPSDTSFIYSGMKFTQHIPRGSKYMPCKEVINEGDPIAVSLVCRNLHRAMHITVD
jgi:hypothetical protein